MNVTFAGGGTGGHLYPAIALADALVERSRRASQPATVQFLGARDRLETKIVPAAGYVLRFVPARALVGSGLRDRLRTVAINASGVAVAMSRLLQHRPDVLIASGGYVCFPVVLAARILRALRLLHTRITLLEINVQPGLTNRLLAPFVDEVRAAFAGSATWGKKYLLTGVPVRATLRALPTRAAAAVRLGLDPRKRTVLVMGGSQGARSINDAILALVTQHTLPADWQVLHVCGADEYERVVRGQPASPGQNDVVIRPYLSDPADAYASADVAITRAGASTLAELTAAGLPAVLVPYPHAAEDHQRANARLFANTGAAVVVDDRDLGADSLWAALSSIAEPRTLERMRNAARSLDKPDAVQTILQRIDALAGPRPSSTGTA